MSPDLSGGETERKLRTAKQLQKIFPNCFKILFLGALKIPKDCVLDNRERSVHHKVACNFPQEPLCLLKCY